MKEYAIKVKGPSGGRIDEQELTSLIATQITAFFERTT